ncbi:MAG: DUF4910 domain-containing protein [Candidatus Methanomethylicia archaeon]
MYLDVLKFISRELSGIRAKEYVTGISCFHRVQSSIGLNEAINYIESQLRSFGIETFTECFPADGKTRFFTFTSPICWHVDDGELIVTKPREMLIGRFNDSPTLIIAHSGSTPPEGVEANVAYVGSGVSDLDYYGRNVNGRFVLAYGRAVNVFRKAVLKYNALGIMVFQRDRIETPEAIPYQSLWIDSDLVDKTCPAFSIPLRYAEKIIHWLERGEDVRVKAKVSSRIYVGEFKVLSGIIRGECDEEIWLIAHACHPKPSANDNASGSGLLIEIARTLKTLIDSGRINKPKRTLRFLWVPEIIGTVAFLEAHPELEGKVIAALNLDMVGENQEQCGSVLTIVSTPNSNPSFLPYLAEHIVEIVSEMDEVKHFNNVSNLPSFKYKLTPYINGSDHYILSDSTIGIPSIAFIHWPDKYYHTDLDTIDKVDPKELKRVGLAVSVIALMLTTPSNSDLELIIDECLKRLISKISFENQKTISKVIREVTEGKSPSRIARELTLGFIKNNEYIELAVNTLNSIRRIYNLTSEDIEEAIKLIRDYGEYEVNRLRKISIKHDIPLIIEYNDYESKAKEIIPMRCFKAPLDFNMFRKLLGEDIYNKYIEMFNHNRNLRNIFDEVINFMNGKRSLLEIYWKVLAEYDNADLKQIMEFVEDLEKINLVKLV